MDNLSDKELCNFCQAAIKTLTEEKKEEVMKCVGTFIKNPKIEEIDKKINSFQKQCKHLNIESNGKCSYCGKQIKLTRVEEI